MAFGYSLRTSWRPRRAKTLRPFTRARDAGAEARAAEVVRALVSALTDAAGDAWAGAALGGALGLGEGATIVARDGTGRPGDPFELLAVARCARPGRPGALEAPRARRRRDGEKPPRGGVRRRPSRGGACVSCLRRSGTWSSSRRGASSRGRSISFRLTKKFFAEAPDRAEGVRLLARTGAGLLSAERLVDRSATGAARARGPPDRPRGRPRSRHASCFSRRAAGHRVRSRATKRCARSRRRGPKARAGRVSTST